MNFKVSYECSDLIAELKEDIAEFGNFDVIAYSKILEGYKVYFDYDFPAEPGEEKPTLNVGETMYTMKALELLAILEEQNRLI